MYMIDPGFTPERCTYFFVTFVQSGGLNGNFTRS